MIPTPFNTPLMEILCKELLHRAANFKVIDCLPCDLRRFSLILEGAKREESLFFCFDLPLVRFHLTHPPKRAVFRSSPLHPLLPYLRGGILHQAAILQHDRILKLTFSTSEGERKLIAEFFSKHPNYYLTDEKGEILFALHPSSHTHYLLPPTRSFSQLPPHWHNHQEVELAYIELENQWKLAKEKQHRNTLLSKQIKSLEKKEQKLINDLNRCKEWEKIQHEGDLIKCHLSSMNKGMPFLGVHDWMTNEMYELVLDPVKTPLEEMAARYKLAKKLHLGNGPLSKQLGETQHELESMKERQQQLELIDTLEKLVKYKEQFPHILQIQQAPAHANLPLLVYKEYHSSSGVKIWVGKNAKGNEKLTFQLANGRDWWLHVKGYSGSHVIIRMNKEQELDAETLKDAFQLALYNSKARSHGEGEICFTQRKYVSRLGQKKVGQVQISKHQTAWVRLDSARLQGI